MKKIILFLAALYTFGAYAQSSRPVDRQGHWLESIRESELQ